MCTQIHSQFVETQPLSTGNGYTWTLASVAGQMLHLAESLYGKRDMDYTFLGVEFSNGQVPRNWFPGERGQVVIQLTNHCLLDPHRACFQLAHEVIHLLSPTGRRSANMLEEGLANHFQTWYMRQCYPKLGWPAGQTTCNVQSYLDAEKLVDELMEVAGPDAIRKLRSHQATISAIGANLVREVLASVRPELAEALAQPFVR